MKRNMTLGIGIFIVIICMGCAGARLPEIGDHVCIITSDCVFGTTADEGIVVNLTPEMICINCSAETTNSLDGIQRQMKGLSFDVCIGYCSMSALRWLDDTGKFLI